jgi:ABC-2 type transport system ATP-binding protein
MIEEPAFYPWLTGRRNLMVLAQSGAPLPGPGDPIATVLDRVGLTEAADRKVKGYSQGMRQRLGLAAALMRKPSLLLLDEPANGLDPAGIAEFRTLMRSLADEGTTVFLSSHLLAEVEQVCDQVAVISAGQLVEQGPVASLAAGRPRVRVVLDPADQQAALALLARWAPRASGPDAVLADGAEGQAVTRALGQAGVWPHQVVLTRPALEETFLTLTDPAPPGDRPCGNPSLTPHHVTSEADLSRFP